MVVFWCVLVAQLEAIRVLTAPLHPAWLFVPLLLLSSVLLGAERNAITAAATAAANVAHSAAG